MANVAASTASLSSNIFGLSLTGWSLVQKVTNPDQTSSGSTVVLSVPGSRSGSATVSSFSVISDLDAVSSQNGGSSAPSVSSSADDTLPATAQSDVFAPLIKLFDSLKIFKESKGQGFERFQSLRAEYQKHTQQPQLQAANTYYIEIDDLGDQNVSMSSSEDRTSIFIVTAIGLHDDQNQWSKTVTNMHQTRERTVAAMKDRPVKDVLARLRYMSSDGKGWTGSQEDAGWFIDQINKGHPKEEPDRYVIFGLIVDSAKVAEQKIAQPGKRI